MINVMFNFNNHVDEVMTQDELSHSPEGLDFIKRWTWPEHECQYDCHPHFRSTNTIEDYFYVRLIEDDRLLAIGAIRIHWNKDGTLMLDNTIQIVRAAIRYHYCEDPCKRYDLEGIIKSKLYQFLHRKLVAGRYCNDYDCNHPVMPPRPPMPPKPNCHDHCYEFPQHGAYGGNSGVIYDYQQQHCDHNRR